MVRSLGADQVIDYTQENFTTSGQRYHVILDNAGNHPLSACRRVLDPKGIFVIAGGPKNVLIVLMRGLRALVMSRFVSQKILFFIARIDAGDLTTMGELMATGRVTPVIDGCYSLSKVPEAMRYLEEGHARGKVVISMENQKT